MGRKIQECQEQGKVENEGVSEGFVMLGYAHDRKKARLLYEIEVNAKARYKVRVFTWSLLQFFDRKKQGQVSLFGYASSRKIVLPCAICCFFFCCQQNLAIPFLKYMPSESFSMSELTKGFLQPACTSRVRVFLN